MAHGDTQISQPALFFLLLFSLAVSCLGLFAMSAFAQDGINIDERVTVTFSGLRFNRRTGTFDSVASLTNISVDPIAAPVSLVVTNVDPASVSLANASGQTADGDSFINVAVVDDMLAPGETVTNIILKFNNPSRVQFAFEHAVLGVIEEVDDTIAPAVTITDPPNLSLFNTSPITVSGIVDDETATVAVDGVVAVLSGNTFSASGVTLTEGNNAITAVATDTANNAGTASISVTLDTTAPIMMIDFPREGDITTQATIGVTGIINDITTGAVDADDVMVEVNGVSAAVSNGSFLATDLSLELGSNTLTATATDAAGNTASDKVTLTRQNMVAQAISLDSGNNQSAPIRTTLPNPLVVQLADTNENPVPNHPVTFSVTRSDGTLSASQDDGVRTLEVLTDAEGHASVSLTLGTRTGAGNNRVKATAVGFVGEVVFCASALAAPATGLKTISGENQRGVVGQLLPEPFVVLAHDSGGNPVEGLPVTFEVLQGGGSFDGAPAMTIPTDRDGRVATVFTLGPQEGINTNFVDVTFPGLTELPAVFTASAFVPGKVEDTKVSGVVLDNSDVPIPGVTARILGTGLEAVTDDQGQFAILGAPVGAITLEVDGTTTPLPGSWPVLDFALTTISGQDNTIGMPIFLLPLDTENAKVVGGPEDVTLQMANVSGLALTVFANSVTCLDGSSKCVAMITQVHRDKVPMPPPGGADPRLVWTIQPAGIHFDPPARITYPNVTGLPPGQIVDVFSFDHDLGQFVSVGTGTVSEDASVIISDPGVGIRKAGWGFPLTPPPPTTCLSQICNPDPTPNNCKRPPSNSCTNLGCKETENEPDGKACKKGTKNGFCKKGECNTCPESTVIAEVSPPVPIDPSLLRAINGGLRTGLGTRTTTKVLPANIDFNNIQIDESVKLKSNDCGNLMQDACKCSGTCKFTVGSAGRNQFHDWHTRKVLHKSVLHEIGKQKCSTVCTQTYSCEQKVIGRQTHTITYKLTRTEAPAGSTKVNFSFITIEKR